jgi:hypothetical protein
MAKLNRLLLLITLLPSISVAATLEDEVAYMISVVDRGYCTFVRNDIAYTNGEFQLNLRSKWQENEELISSAEDFIERIATRRSASEVLM